MVDLDRLASPEIDALLRRLIIAGASMAGGVVLPRGRPGSALIPTHFVQESSTWVLLRPKTA
jgi:hypothetical protein